MQNTENENETLQLLANELTGMEGKCNLDFVYIFVEDHSDPAMRELYKIINMKSTKVDSLN